MLKGKRVFVSGGAGVIGQELVAKLVEQGANVFVGDLKPKPVHWSQLIRYRQGDLNEITNEELMEFAPEIFFHLAATFERSEESYDFWGENERHNVRLSHHLMDCLKDSKSLERVVFASSYLIYNPDLYQFNEVASQARPLVEKDPIYPRNLCGAAKLLHEIELRFLNDLSNSNYTTVSARIYRVYGKNSRDVISRWIQDLLNGQTIQIYRKEGMFDYIYAGDVAEGLLRLAVSEASGIVNLGNGNARRVEEVINILRKHFPEMSAVEGNSNIPFEASQADMQYFEQLTNWRPNRQIEETIPELISHYSNVKENSDNIAGSVLVTSVSKKVPLLNCLRTAMNKLGQSRMLVGGDHNPYAIGRYFVDLFWEMSRIDEIRFEQLLAYCLENNIKYIIPTRDGELEYFARIKNSLEQHGIHVMISELEGVQTCLDKLLFYHKGQELGIPVIPTYDMINNQTEDRWVVKERFGAGSQSIGLNLSRDEALNHALKLKQPVFQPFIKGMEVSVDVYIQRDTKFKGAVARKREVVVNGESQVTTTFRDERLESMCAKFAEKLGLYGHVVFQVIIDEKREYHFIECNSRFGGASRLSVAVGLDSFYWFLLESEGTDIREYPFIRSSKEMKLIRYAEDIIQ